MEEQILEILKKEKQAISVTEINNKLNLSSPESLKKVLKVLVELEKDLKVYRTKKEKYILFENSHFQVGRLIVNKKGFGFVDVNDDEDIYIHGLNMNGAIHGDIVAIEIIHLKGVKKEGRVVKIIERKIKQLIGEIYFENGKGYLKLDDEKIKIKIEINQKHTLGAVEGHKVLVKLKKHFKKNLYSGEVIRIIGHKNDPGVDIMSIAAKYGINDIFKNKVLKELETIQDKVTVDEIKNREIGRASCRERV